MKMFLIQTNFMELSTSQIFLMHLQYSLGLHQNGGGEVGLASGSTVVGMVLACRLIKFAITDAIEVRSSSIHLSVFGIVLAAGVSVAMA